VVVASLDSSCKNTRGANKICIAADVTLENVQDDNFDMIILPGGWGGTYKLADDSRLQQMLKKQKQEDKYIGAICAAPYALEAAGVLEGDFTCYPGAREEIKNPNYHESTVVRNGKQITSRGPATAICFALEIVKELQGDTLYTQIKNGVLANYCE
jgi:4-methyl-5(b-hydroxyethyl)-thiazole monophosphate biosynthesis